ncbi:hypothetical protein [Bartonella bacilliformis]|nr:hypothetical protein [Bartonella bacilliformis]
MLIGPTIIGQTMNLKPFGFSSVMAFLGAYILILVRVFLMKKLINS